MDNGDGIETSLRGLTISAAGQDEDVAGKQSVLRAVEHHKHSLPADTHVEHEEL